MKIRKTAARITAIALLAGGGIGIATGTAAAQEEYWPKGSGIAPATGAAVQEQNWPGHGGFAPADEGAWPGHGGIAPAAVDTNHDGTYDTVPPNEIPWPKGSGIAPATLEWPDFEAGGANTAMPAEEQWPHGSGIAPDTDHDGVANYAPSWCYGKTATAATCAAAPAATADGWLPDYPLNENISTLSEGMFPGHGGIAPVIADTDYDG